MRLIDADILKKSLSNKNLITWTHEYGDAIPIDWIMSVINNTPELGYEDGILSVENATRRAIELEEAYNNGWSDGFSEGENERPQDEWIFNGEICQCPFCFMTQVLPYNYCPNCGAKLGNEEE